MTSLLGEGDFVAWDGGCLLIGKAHRPTGIHSHYAVQFSFGERDGIRFRDTETDAWTSYDGAVIPSRRPHAMDASPVNPSATLLIEQETPVGRALEARFTTGGISAVARAQFATDSAALFAAWRAHRAGDQTAAAAARVVSGLAGGIVPSAVSDQRIARATAFINANLGETITLQAVAREVFLSPPRFRHLFVEQTGTAFRPYVLWRRFLRSWSLIRAGAPISAAAHEAGFADAAHLTRTSQRMFGFAPSALLVDATREAREQQSGAPEGATESVTESATESVTESATETATKSEQRSAVRSW